MTLRRKKLTISEKIEIMQDREKNATVSQVGVMKHFGLPVLPLSNIMLRNFIVFCIRICVVKMLISAKTMWDSRRNFCVVLHKIVNRTVFLMLVEQDCFLMIFSIIAIFVTVKQLSNKTIYKYKMLVFTKATQDIKCSRSECFVSDFCIYFHNCICRKSYILKFVN
jgi:hypothetical protein